MLCLAVFVLVAAVFDRELIRQAYRQGRGLSPGDRFEVEGVVRLYNSIYQDFHATGGNPVMIDDFPTSKTLKHFVFRDIGYLRDAGLLEVYDLASLEIIEVSGAADRAEVVTAEEWNHVLQRRADRTPVTEIRGFSLRARYLLERRAGFWTVVAWDPEPERAEDRRRLP